MRRRIFLAGAAAQFSWAATVRVPPVDLIETAIAEGSFTTLLSALEAADLAEWLKTAGPISFFAPTNEAFAKLPKGRLAELLRPESRAELRSILLYQMVSGRYSIKDVRYMYSARTLEGHKLSFHYFPDGMRVDNARVLSAVPASNGVLHAIDSVVMPYTPVLIER